MTRKEKEEFRAERLAERGLAPRRSPTSHLFINQPGLETITTFHHLAIWGDYIKIMNLDDLKNEYKFAAYACQDNMKIEDKAYVVTPDGEVFEIFRSKGTGYRKTGSERQAILEKYNILVQ